MLQLDRKISAAIINEENDVHIILECIKMSDSDTFILGKSIQNLLPPCNMENDILNCLSETERLRRKVSKFQQRLWIREDDLMEEINEFHNDLTKQIEKHRENFIAKVKTNLFDIKKRIEAPVAELEGRLEKVTKLKDMYKTLDNDSIAQVLSEIRADNLRLETAYQNLDSSCMSQMKLTQMPGILGEFKDALEQNQILYFRYGQSSSAADVSSHHLDNTSSSSLTKINLSDGVLKSGFGNNNYLITPHQLDYSSKSHDVITSAADPFSPLLFKGQNGSQVHVKTESQPPLPSMYDTENSLKVNGDGAAFPQALAATSSLLNNSVSDSNGSLGGVNVARSIDTSFHDGPNGYASDVMRRPSLSVGRGSRPFHSDGVRGMGRSYQLSQYLVTPGLNSSSLSPTQNDEVPVVPDAADTSSNASSSKIPISALDGSTSALDRSADRLAANLIDLNVNDLNAAVNSSSNSVKSEPKQEINAAAVEKPKVPALASYIKKEPIVEYWDDIDIVDSSTRCAASSSSSSATAGGRRNQDDSSSSVVDSSSATAAAATATSDDGLDPSKDTTKKRFDISRLFRRGDNNTTTIRARSVIKLGAAKQCTPPEAYFKFPIGCSKNERNGDWLVCDTRHEAVKIYSNDGRPKVMINGSDNPDMRFSSPSSIVPLWNNNFVVKDNFSLFRFSEQGNLLATYSGRFKKLYGLCLDEQYNLLTLDLNARPKSLLLSIDPMSGKVLRETDFSAHRSAPNSKCRFMDYFNRKLVVVDLGAHQVYVCDDDCNLKFRFGEYQRSRGEPGRFNEPSGVTMDMNGHMLIGDSRNDRVQIWSNEGKWLGDVTFNERIVRPSNIHLTLDGYLMVMNYVEHYVNIFKLE